MPSGWGWTASPDFSGRKYIYISQCIQTNGVWGQWSATKIYSVYPEKGDPSPAVVFRGEWAQVAAPKIFYNNAARRDVVQFTGIYYIYKGTDGATVTSFDYSRWETFGAQFSSVATDLLYTPNGNVGGWIFQNERMISQTGGTYLNGKTGLIESANDGNRMILDPGERVISFVNEFNQEMIRIGFDIDVSGAPNAGMEIKRYGLGGTILRSGSIYDGRVLLSSENGNKTIMLDVDTGIEYRYKNDVSFVNNLLFRVTPFGGDGGVLHIEMAGIPDSPTGLPANTIYRSGDTLKITQ